jgi:hypothetical protein
MTRDAQAAELGRLVRALREALAVQQAQALETRPAGTPGTPGAAGARGEDRLAARQREVGDLLAAIVRLRPPRGYTMRPRRRARSTAARQSPALTPKAA